MNINFSGDTLYSGFNLVTSIVSSSAMKSILKGIKIGVKGGYAELIATDLEVLVKYQMLVKASVEGEGIVLPAVRVNSILREWAGNEDVSMLIEGNSCMLKSKGGYFKISGENASQFPGIALAETKGFVEIDGEIISDMVGKVIHAASTVKARSTLCGVIVKVVGDDIVMVAADGNRMSSIKRKVSNTDGVQMEGIVAVKCLMFLQRFVMECKGPLRIGIGESHVRFAGERGEVVSQLIDGQYPKYEDVIPKGNDRKIEVNKDELLTGVRMASFMTSEGYRIVKFIFRQGKLILSSKAADVGEAEVEITVKYEGPDFEIGFNPDFVMDALKVSDSDNLVMELGDGDSAVLLRTGYEQLEVIMPIELK